MAAGAMSDAPLVVIAGPTASGKTALAIRLALRFNGEIICADSRTIYRGMDIGTAKPSIEERQGVPHWGLDIIDPNESYSAASFKYYAQQKIQEVRSRGHVPFLVGGTGLYVDAVLFDYQFGPAADVARRRELEAMDIQTLYKYCLANNVKLPENSQNKRYVIRAIEQAGEKSTRRFTPVENSIIVGIATDRVELRQRMARRTEQLFEQGVVEEAKMLGKKYGWNAPGMSGNVYRLLEKYFQGEVPLAEVKDKNTTYDWQLAKRQLTWLRRNNFVHWYSLEQAEAYIVNELAKRL